MLVKTATRRRTARDAILGRLDRGPLSVTYLLDALEERGFDRWELWAELDILHRDGLVERQMNPARGIETARLAKRAVA